MLIKVMNGGGAERVISLLANFLLEQDWNVTLLLTHQKLKDADLTRLNKGVRVISLEDEVPLQKSPSQFRMLYARILGRLLRIVNAPEDMALVEKYAARNSAKIQWLKQFFKEHRKATAIAFLYDSIFLALLAKGKDNRLIISERGDPGQSLGSKTDMAFFRTMFPKADAMVFQSPDVQKWYKEKLGIGGELIFNPITEDLPAAWHGERKKRIVNFCRINPQKNLFLLIDAFELFHKDYPEYELWIYGNVSTGDEVYYQFVNAHAQNCICKDRIHLEPARKNIHSLVLDAAMFVSSSDFEGMSNSMLEAMAIGLPVVCTDCPAGGAKAVIKDHENGLLVPIKDKQKLYLAMKEIIDNPKLAEKLARNAVRIGQTQSEKVILNKWLNLVNARGIK